MIPESVNGSVLGSTLGARGAPVAPIPMAVAIIPRIYRHDDNLIWLRKALMRRSSLGVDGET